MQVAPRSHCSEYYTARAAWAPSASTPAASASPLAAYACQAPYQLRREISVSDRLISAVRAAPQEQHLS